VASYQSVVYETQRVYTSGATMAGFFTLGLDRSSMNVWGGANTSTSISVTATDVVLKAALEAMPNVGKVYVQRNPLATPGNFEWLVTFTSLLGDVPQLTVVSLPTTGASLLPTGAPLCVCVAVCAVAALAIAPPSLIDGIAHAMWA
jgi:hypothetical protein